jgi:uncharacterized protein (DUF697 family)
MLPDLLKEGMQKALNGLVDLSRAGGPWAATPESVLDPHQLTTEEVRERLPVETVLSLCDAQAGPSVLSATLQGAGLGLGGVTLALADVPLLLSLHLRLLTQLGFCCGLDLRPPEERPFILKLLELGYCLRDWEERRRVVRELGPTMFDQTSSITESGDEFGDSILVKSVGNFVEKVVPILLRRRASTVLPLLGGVIAAGANYTLTNDVAESGNQMLIKRLLIHRARVRAGRGEHP